MGKTSVSAYLGSIDHCTIADLLNIESSPPADTTGVKEGDIPMRSIESEVTPIPKVTKLALKDLDRYLPKDTKRVFPEQRKAALRVRRTGYQLRHYGW